MLKIFMRGFGSPRRGTFVSAKVPKSILLRTRPLRGASASVPNQDFSGTRFAQTSLAETSIGGCGSAASKGHEINKPNPVS